MAAAGFEMRFSADYAADLEAIRVWGPPYALVRFGDGERALMEGSPIAGIDGWVYRGGPHWLQQPLLDALACDDEGYHVGRSCPCCDPDSSAYFEPRIGVPPARRTFANLFVNANWPRFQEKLNVGALDQFTIVASVGGTIPIPVNCVEHELDLDPILAQMFASAKPLLVSGGPVAKVLVHRYWREAPQPQIILDVGSALDPALKRRGTRPYHDPTRADASRVCHWPLPLFVRESAGGANV